MTAVTPFPAVPAFHAACGAGVPNAFIANARPGQPVLVAVHGASRNAAEIALRFAAHPAFARTTIVAPLFTREGFGAYQQLQTRRADQTPADVGLIRLLDALAAEHGIAAERFGLFGFASGAQMAQRFALFHPQRVARLCVASAGWYCLPSTDLAYPYGIGDGGGAALVGPGFLAIPTTVIVGNRDTRVSPRLRQDPPILEHQGRNRLRRARCYGRAVKTYAEAIGQRARVRVLAVHAISPDFAQSADEGDLIALAAQSLL